IMLCSHANPSGCIYTRAELQSLVDVLADYPDILILSDEIYRHINYTGTYTSLATFPAVADRVVVINGVSKAYAMTGWRIGFMAGPLSVAKAVTKLQGQYTSGTSSIAQKAAEAAYTGPQECVEEMRVAFERRRNLVYHLACEIPGLKVREPQGAFYLFPEVSAYFGLHTPDGQTIADANDLAMYLLTDGHVATVSGDAFGLPGYLRLSYATSDDRLTEAFARITAALSRLK
ncbi:MAG: aminotransferase class I/II-fold pyridoxal phosphate-dependent enzyme, partial [Paramuribaculum sp.]|nr:aminotransferase class I/II-fold pyridoxal phosphate-dependent enzyme [Paramuribaculum sp.]